ncbi:TIGR04222 domain-containing membrane protein [Actinocorallia aurantiaca]|uniref:TIGR04222 domain-containing membrane protein n=1 Tax=Actinocorallia aurantiaca TaxID=46204 RepID=A0ABN3UH11_9ACTN
MTDPAPTWGISGPSFLVLFVSAAVALSLLAIGLRRLSSAGRAPVRELHPHELAYLDGGRARVVAASLAALRLTGAISARYGGKLRVTGAPGPAAAPLDHAVLQAIAAKTRSKDLATHTFVRPHLDHLRDTLAAEGLLNGPGARARTRLAALPLLLLLVLGVLRIGAGLQNDKPVGFLIFLVICVVPVAGWLLLSAPERTGAATRALRDVRRRNEALRPSSSPNWPAYGPQAAALSVAVFGAQALVVMDPEFASAAEVQRHFAQSTASSGSSYSDGGSSDGGSSDGGGGGGGCGGGGCGG